MFKRLFLSAVLCLSLGAVAADTIKAPVPEAFSTADIKGDNPEFLEKYFIIANFEQQLQMGEGKVSSKDGRILVIEKGGTTFFAFYYLTDSGEYRKIGRTLATKDITFPRQDLHPEYNIPCLVVSKNDNSGTYRIYLYNGNTVIQKITPEETAQQ